MNRYKEIPIDDNRGAEQFEGAKCLKIYTMGYVNTGGDYFFTTKSFDIDGTKIRIKKLDEIGFDVYHYKQCRKLEKVKPREFAVRDDLSSIMEIRDGAVSRPSIISPGGRGGFLHLREVLDD